MKVKSVKRRNIRKTITSHLILIILAIIWLYPILWMVLTAFRSEYNDQGKLIGIVSGNYFPKQLGFDNFINLFNGHPDSVRYSTGMFPRWFMNTLVVSKIGRAHV